MHPNCYKMIEKFIGGLVPKKEGLSVCDVGSFNVNGTFRKCFPPNCSYTGIDIRSGKDVDIVLKDPHRWTELDGKQFDVVISGNTIEHVKDIYQWFREFAKIIKPDGVFFIISPRPCVKIHKYPIDCWRIMPDGMQFLVEEIAGLKMVKCYLSHKDVITTGRKQ